MGSALGISRKERAWFSDGLRTPTRWWLRLAGIGLGWGLGGLLFERA